MCETVATAGEKQIVMGGSEIAFATILLSFYIAHRTGGAATAEKTTTITDDADNGLKVTINEKTTYIDPFGAIGQLIKKIVGGSLRS